MTNLQGNELTLLFTAASESRANHSRLSSGLHGLRGHLEEARREGLGRGARLDSLNATLGEAARELARAAEKLGATQAEQGADLARLETELETTEAALERHRGESVRRTEAAAAAVAALDFRLNNRTAELERGLGAVANHSAELAANFSRMLVFAAANKAEVLELKVIGNALGDRVDRLSELHDERSAATAAASRHAAGNITRLHGAASALGRDVDAMTERLQTMERLMSEHIIEAGRRLTHDLLSYCLELLESTVIVE